MNNTSCLTTTLLSIRVVVGGWKKSLALSILIRETQEPGRRTHIVISFTGAKFTAIQFVLPYPFTKPIHLLSTVSPKRKLYIDGYSIRLRYTQSKPNHNIQAIIVLTTNHLICINNFKILVKLSLQFNHERSPHTYPVTVNLTQWSTLPNIIQSERDYFQIKYSSNVNGAS